MQVPLIATKLTIPPVQREVVPRPRLVEQLNLGLAGKLILVSAPAGYGKTLLLSAWASQCGLPVTWISLDEGDNDLARFLAYLVAALEKVKPGLGKGGLPLLQSPQFPPPDELLAGILNEITQLEKPFVLVLDDYHLIHEPAVHNTLIYLLGHLPPQIRLVIVSRADPPLQLARWRARSELVELRLADLCFSLEEAAQFCNQVMALGLPADQVTALVARTEGWIAGLQMAAISLRGATDPSGFIQSFSSSHRFILDYLVEEVLKGQPGEVQSFLLKTSVLDRLNGSLCDAVTGLHNSQEILEDLERQNLFIIPLDEERSWYRYHQLFLDLLRKRAQRLRPDEVANWHQAASRWYAGTGDLEEAIEHALAAGEFGRAADLVETAAQPTLIRSEIYTFRGWVGQLPEEMIRARPGLVLFYALVLVLSDVPAETVESWLQRADLSSERNAGKAGVIRGYLHFMQGEVSRAADVLQKSLDSIAVENSLFRSVAAYILSCTQVMEGKFETGSRVLEEVLQTSLQQRQVIIAAGALCTLAEVNWRLGKLHNAKGIYERVLAIAVDPRGQRLPIAARALMGLGELYREWNELEQAASYCREGIELAKHLRAGAALTGYITLARIYQAWGDWQASRAAIQKAGELAQQTEGTGLDDLYEAVYRAALDVRQGDLDPVEAWFQQLGLTGEFDPADLDQKENYYKYHVLKYELLVLARLFIARDQPQKALALVGILRAKMEEQGRVHLVIETLLLSALAQQKIGEQSQALEAFERCLHLAEPGGYVRLFLDEGPAARPLLQKAMYGKTTPDYARRLLAALEAEIRSGHREGSPQKSTSPQSTGLVEALSEREIELLTLIAAGLSNQEIAQRLFISLPTVKWHTTHIYSKLGVRSRTQAVIQARSLGILPPG